MRRLIVVVVAVLAVLATAGALSVVRGDDSELTSPAARASGREAREAAALGGGPDDEEVRPAPARPRVADRGDHADDPAARADRPARWRRPRATWSGRCAWSRLYAEPGKRPFAKVPPRQFQETWLPVVDREDGWVKVLLPSRPNGASGWLRESRVETARSPYVVRVHLTSRTLDIVYEGSSIGTWPVAIGEPSTPTPPGRTFLLGSVIDTNQSYSPIILPLGSHSDTLDSYGGGPGTVALHGWPDESVFGTAASHGCIRVPAEALDRLTQVPLGTLVVVDER